MDTTLSNSSDSDQTVQAVRLPLKWSGLCQQWTEQPNEHRTMMFGLSFYSQ
ncbi:hypothetical protein ECFRIK1985_6011 [Escherichia coli FRIK1985]|nr:hypothetical protein ECFRIK1985_6011 [Escherichia coli FRIK1985]